MDELNKVHEWIMDLRAYASGSGGTQLSTDDCIDLADALESMEQGAIDALYFKEKYDTLCDALKTHSGDADGYEFGLGRVRFDNGRPVSFLWAGQDEIDDAIAAATKEIITAQHDETGRLWTGLRSALPHRFAEVAAPVPAREWIPVGELGEDDSDTGDAARFRALPRMTLAIIWRRPNPLLGDLKDGYDIESLRVWTDAAMKADK